MAYEILNSAQTTPHRLHALLRLVPRVAAPTRQKLVDLLQPPGVSASQEAAEGVYRAAVNCRLLIEQEGPGGQVHLAVKQEEIENFEGFRQVLCRTLLGITDDQSPNFLLNLFAAWYAAQDQDVLLLDVKEFERRFNQGLYPGDRDRAFNVTKWQGWKSWAVFLGWGWSLKLGSAAEKVVPDAYGRLLPELDKLLPDGAELVSFGTFARRLGDRCPELDGGILFERAWSAAHGQEQRGNRLSLMLSAGLRGLHDRSRIRLVRVPDATQVWSLYPSSGHGLRDVSHIALGAN